MQQVNFLPQTQALTKDKLLSRSSTPGLKADGFGSRLQNQMTGLSNNTVLTTGSQTDLDKKTAVSGSEPKDVQGARGENEQETVDKSKPAPAKENQKEPAAEAVKSEAVEPAEPEAIPMVWLMGAPVKTEVQTATVLLPAEDMEADEHMSMSKQVSEPVREESAPYAVTAESMKAEPDRVAGPMETAAQSVKKTAVDMNPAPADTEEQLASAPGPGKPAPVNKGQTDWTVHGEQEEKSPSAEEKTLNGTDELKKLIDSEAQRAGLPRAKAQDRAEKTEAAVKAPAESDSKQLWFSQRLDNRWPLENMQKAAAAPVLPGQLDWDADDLINQMVKKADILMRKNASEIKMQLHPEFLGKMTIKVLIEDGVLTARFFTENLQVKQVLENNLAALRQSFEAQGLKVEKTEVNVQVDADGNQQDAQQQGQQSGRQPSGHRNLPWEDYRLESTYQPETALTAPAGTAWWEDLETQDLGSIDYRI